MLKQILLMIVGFISGLGSSRTKGSSWLAEVGLRQIRQMIAAIFAGVLGVVFFSTGLGLVVREMDRSYEQQRLLLEGPIYLGMTMIGLFLVSLYFCFRGEAWGIVKVHTEEDFQSKKTEESPLVQALSVLILDFVEERKAKRAEAQRGPIASPGKSPRENYEDMAIYEGMSL